MNDDHIARLESEIRYLKGMLDENGISYDYEAFVEAAMREKSVEIEFPTLTPEHAIHFYSYFRGRKDVYVKRNAKKGYSIRNATISGRLGYVPRREVKR
jgi:hypothetical protein